MIDGSEHPVGPGDTCWIPPGLPHYFRNASASEPLVATGETRPVAAEHTADRLLTS